EGARVADAGLADEAHVVAADQHVRGDGDLEPGRHERQLSAWRRLGGGGRRRAGGRLRPDAGGGGEELLPVVEGRAGGRALDGGTGLAAGGADDEEARLGQSGARRRLRRGTGDEAGGQDDQEGRGQAACGGGWVRQVHGSVLRGVRGPADGPTLRRLPATAAR